MNKKNKKDEDRLTYEDKIEVATILGILMLGIIANVIFCF